MKLYDEDGIDGPFNQAMAKAQWTVSPDAPPLDTGAIHRAPLEADLAATRARLAEAVALLEDARWRAEACADEPAARRIRAFLARERAANGGKP